MEESESGKGNAQDKVNRSHLRDPRDVDPPLATHELLVEERNRFGDGVLGGVALRLVFDVAFRFEEADERAVKDGRYDEIQIAWDPFAGLERLEDRRATDYGSRLLKHLTKRAEFAKVRPQESAEPHSGRVEEERSKLWDGLSEVDDVGEEEVGGDHSEEVV